MKKSLLVVVLLFAVVLSNAQVKKVAIVGLSSNTVVRTDGFEDVGLTALADLFMGKEFNVQNEMVRFRDYLYGDLAEEFPFELVPEETLLANEQYAEFRKEVDESALTKISKLVEREALEGYTVYQGLTKKKIEELSKIFPDADAFMVVPLSYSIASKMMVNGNGKAGAKAQAQIYLYHKSGKNIMRLSSSGMSDQGFVVVAEQITSNRDKIPAAMQEASDDLFEEMPKDLPKRIKKMKRKLSKI